jgi:large subunit ribosomal protein L21
MDYAIIELCGKQYRVQTGDTVLVDRLDAKQGAKLAPRPLMWRSNGKTVLDGPDLGKVKVEAVVVEHLKGEKVRVFKYRPKKRYRRSAGHRSLLTRIEIKGISGPGSSKASTASEGRKPAAADAEKPAKAPAAPKAGADASKKSPATKAAEGEAKETPAKKKGTAGTSPKKPSKPAGESQTSKKD